jgi:lysophospholipase L1-like esterase
MTLFFLGDSLMAVNDATSFPQRGWPQALDSYLKDPQAVKIVDTAKNGSSTKSFLDEGRFAMVLQLAKPQDIAFISFGHNDEKKEDPARYAEAGTLYEENLRFMIQELAKKETKVILLSSICRLRTDSHEKIKHTHGDYPKAMAEVAASTGVPYLDLEALTYADLSQHDFLENSRHYMILPPNVYPNYPHGSSDTSHLSREGSQWICQLLLPSLKALPMLQGIFA